MATLAAMVTAGVAGCAVRAAGPSPTAPSPTTIAAPVAVQPSASVRVSGQYVALGDSYAAGPGIPVQTAGPLGWGCARSSSDYPALVDAAARYRLFQDVSCSGATTADMLGPQPTRAGVNPPQLDALTSTTTVVTVTIGGNDIGFADIIGHCLPQSDSPPRPCHGRYNAGGADLLAGRIAAAAPKVAAVLQQIIRRAPTATVLIVGYPTLLPATGAGCPDAPVNAGDTLYLNGTFQALNLMLRQQADQAGVGYVDTADSSVGHDICTSTGTRWVEGPHPTSPAAAYHPNALGMRNSATQVLHTLPLTPDLSREHSLLSIGDPSAAPSPWAWLPRGE